MDFKKDNNLISGKGEWDESDHPRDSDGKFTSAGGGTGTHNNKTIMDNEKKDAVKHLVDTLRKVKNVKIKEIHNYIKSLDPIKLEIKGDEILAEFDKFTADKNVYGHGKSDKEGYEYKLEHPSQLPSIVKNSQYTYSKNEKGKNRPQHKGVNQWHYFINNIKTENGDFGVVVNVRDKGDNQFIYEVALKKKKT